MCARFCVYGCPSGSKLCQKLWSVHEYANALSLDEQDIEDHQKELLKKLFRTIYDKSVLFQHLSPKAHYVGSYSNRTRVGLANEFDVDLVVRLPDNNIEASLHGCPVPSMIKLRIPEDFKLCSHHAQPNDMDAIYKWVSDEGYLRTDKFRHWMRDLIQSAVDSLDCIYFVSQNFVDVQKAGPAYTLHVSYNGLTYSIDIVPVLELCPRKNPVLFCPSNSEKVIFPKGHWYAVPKRVPDYDDNTLWRTSFPTQESEIFEPCKNLLPTLRLVKVLRNKMGWEEELCSYYIKTVFLLEAEKKQPTDFWSSCICKLFVHMLNVLLKCLRKRRIRYFWHRSCNLLSRVSDTSLRRMEEELEIIIPYFKDGDPDAVSNYLEYRRLRKRRSCCWYHTHKERIHKFSS